MQNNLFKVSVFFFFFFGGGGGGIDLDIQGQI